MEYKMISDAYPNSFNRILSEFVDEGWQPYGNLKMAMTVAYLTKNSHETYVQCVFSLLMCRETEATGDG